jgi:hypothetical protein
MADQAPTDAAPKQESPPEPQLVEALWVAPFEAQLADGTVLVPNETTARVPEGEAKASDHWKPVGAAGAAKGRDEKVKEPAGKDGES